MSAYYTEADAAQDSSMLMEYRREEFELDNLELSGSLASSWMHLSRLARFAKEVLGDEGRCEACANSAVVGVGHPASFESPTALAAKLPMAMAMEDHAIRAAKVDVRQLTKDVSRDDFILQGERIMGAKQGLNGIVKKLLAAMASSCSDFGVHAIPRDVAQHMIYVALTGVNRTNSSGLALETLRKILPAHMGLLPLSDAADPLVVSVRFGSCPQLGVEVPDACSQGGADTGAHMGVSPCSWGLVLHLRGTAMFRVMEDINVSMSSSDDVCDICAMYTQDVYLPFDAESTPTRTVLVPKTAHIHFTPRTSGSG